MNEREEKNKSEDLHLVHNLIASNCHVVLQRVGESIAFYVTVITNEVVRLVVFILCVMSSSVVIVFYLLCAFGVAFVAPTCVNL